MGSGILAVLGGVGLFLFGMQTMTAALRQIFGRRARRALSRFTRSRLSGVLSGALVTAALHSSAAVTATAVGFVGAGLLTFPQAVSVIFGANVGTTATGWIVMILGFKLQLGLSALGLILAGSLMRVVQRPGWTQAGAALSGFGLLLFGIEMLKGGVAGLDSAGLTEFIPADDFGGRLLLALAGMLMTAVTQSSSAGVAATLALLAGGAMSFQQAAALVIGMDIGTTSGALLASVGGSRDMRRTGLAHVMYNAVTGILAFAILEVGALMIGPARIVDPLAALVSFHTGFNLAGVVLILPFLDAFTRLVERLVPERGRGLAEALDYRLLADTDTALDAAQSAATVIGRAVFAELARKLVPDRPDPMADASAHSILSAIAELEEFLARISVGPKQPVEAQRLSALLHQCDHMRRLLRRSGQEDRVAVLSEEAHLARTARAVGEAMRRAAVGQDGAMADPRLGRLAALIDEDIAHHRRETLRGEHAGPMSPGDLFPRTDAMRWLARVSHHAARIAYYSGMAADLARDGNAPGIKGSRPAPG